MNAVSDLIRPSVILTRIDYATELKLARAADGARSVASEMSVKK